MTQSPESASGTALGFETSEQDSIGLARIDAAGQIVWANGEFADLVGIEHADLLHRSIDQVFPSLVLDATSGRRNQVVRPTSGDGIISVEVTAPNASNGRTIAAVAAGGPDRARSSAALGRRYQALFDNSSDGIVLVDPSTGRIVDLNRTIANVLGFERSWLVGRHLRVVLPAADREGPWSEVGTRAVRFEVDMRRADQSAVPVEVSAVRFELDGRPVVQHLVRDITERRKVDQLKDEFVSVVSHELRTPLTSIVGSLGLLAGGASGELSPQTLALVQMAHKNAERLRRLIDDILDVEKIRAQSFALRTRAVDMVATVQQAVESNEAYAGGFGVSFELICDVAHAPVDGDPDRLVQVITNLLSNAVKYSPRGGVVTVRVATPATSVRVSVRDRGKGIPQEFRDRIFDKFAQADSSTTRSKGGTGLGLSIAKAIVDLHAGSIDFDTGPAGTTFFFDLPLARGAVPTAQITPPRGTVLLFADNGPATDRVIARIRDTGFDVMRASPSDHLAAQDPDIVAILFSIDLGWPVVRDVLESLRERDASRVIPFWVYASIVQGGALLGCTVEVVQLLTRPVEPSRLMDAAAMVRERTKKDRLRILQVQSEADTAEVTSVLLHRLGDSDISDSLADARERMRNDKFDLLILDATLPDGAGLELVATASPDHDAPPCIVMADDLAAMATPEAMSYVRRACAPHDFVRRAVMRSVTSNHEEIV